MEEIVLRARRRTGASRVQIECEWRVDGAIVGETVPRRVTLANGVSQLTFEQACELFDTAAQVVQGFQSQQALFSV